MKRLSALTLLAAGALVMFTENSTEGLILIALAQIFWELICLQDRV